MNANFLNNIDASWTLFLDRDGVINTRKFGGYITSPDEFEFNPKVLESIAYFTQTFNKIIIVTNQQGVGKGLMTEEALKTVHSFMISEIEKKSGKIDSIYYCTDLADSDNNCRKPSPVMAQKAIADNPEIDINKSIMVGDSLSDIEFGKNAGMKTVFITSSGDGIIASELADYVCHGLFDFRNSLEKQIK